MSHGIPCIYTGEHTQCQSVPCIVRRLIPGTQRGNQREYDLLHFVSQRDLDDGEHVLEVDSVHVLLAAKSNALHLIVSTLCTTAMARFNALDHLVSTAGTTGMSLRIGFSIQVRFCVSGSKAIGRLPESAGCRAKRTHTPVDGVHDVVHFDRSRHCKAGAAIVRAGTAIVKFIGNAAIILSNNACIAARYRTESSIYGVALVPRQGGSGSVVVKLLTATRTAVVPAAGLPGSTTHTSRQYHRTSRRARVADSSADRSSARVDDSIAASGVLVPGTRRRT
eukprot:2596066-Rhodomonas_salina.2